MGALVQIVRAGDVIPYILEVVEPAAKPMMPSDMPDPLPYIWDANHVQVLLPAAKDIASGTKEKEALLGAQDKVKIKELEHFFRKMGIANMGLSRCTKVWNSGLRSSSEILAMPEDELVSRLNDALTKKGTGKVSKVARDVAQAIQVQKETVPLTTLMDASSEFGRAAVGESVGRGTAIAGQRITDIMKTPAILTSTASDEDKVQAIRKMSIEMKTGIGIPMARRFVERIPAFKAWLAASGLSGRLDEAARTVVEPEAAAPGPLSDQVVVLTDIKKGPLTKVIEAAGGKVASSVTKTTTVVVTGKGEPITSPEGLDEKEASNLQEYGELMRSSSGKGKKAQASGIPVVSEEAFLKRFGLN